MFKKLDNKGISLVELIAVIAIIAVLASAIIPSLVKYITRAKQVQMQEEASALMKAAQVAMIEVNITGKAPNDNITHVTDKSSKYYKNGTKYGKLTNWTVKNGVVADAANAKFGEEFFSLLDIGIGKEWKNGSSSIPVSSTIPSESRAGSLTKECIFQVFYDKDANIILEYSRDGCFIRMENYVIVDTIQIKNKNEKNFTVWTS